MRKRFMMPAALGIAACLIAGCGGRTQSGQKPEFSSEQQVWHEEKKADYIHAEGETLETRIRVPEGYLRTKEAEGSLGAFLRNYQMKPDGSPVLLYNGRKKANQRAHCAVFRLPLEDADLQQCADSVMRVYAEYYYQEGAYDRIRFTLGGGFDANFTKWSSGCGIRVSGNDVSWVSAPGNDTGYASFQKFMRMVFAYSGTMNMVTDSKPVSLPDLAIGDIFIKGGSPGHVVMVVDLCENGAGKKAFLLAQGYMPAQEFQLLRNPKHRDDPWYYEDEVSYPFRTPEYTFDEGSLMRYRLSPLYQDGRALARKAASDTAARDLVYKKTDKEQGSGVVDSGALSDCVGCIE